PGAGERGGREQVPGRRGQKNPKDDQEAEQQRGEQQRDAAPCAEPSPAGVLRFPNRFATCHPVRFPCYGFRGGSTKSHPAGPPRVTAFEADATLGLARRRAGGSSRSTPLTIPPARLHAVSASELKKSGFSAVRASSTNARGDLGFCRTTARFLRSAASAASRSSRPARRPPMSAFPAHRRSRSRRRARSAETTWA